MEIDNVALIVKQVDLATLPLPPGFKVTFEHVTNQHHDDQEAHGHQS
jgi:hypothetical protein